jgi:methenyltetrahydrofolate cyclohydrolase
MLTHKSVKEFLDELASGSPAPGGGSVAALCGSLASALCSMVCRLTIGKKKYADVSEELQTVLEKTEFYRNEFTRLIDEDTKAFMLVMDAFKLPKTTVEEIKIRDNAVDDALKYAVEIPMEVLKYTSEMIEFSVIIANKGNINSASDASVGALLLQSTGLAALYNILINLKSIQDTEFVESKHDELTQYTSKIETYSAALKDIAHKNFA